MSWPKTLLFAASLVLSSGSGVLASPPPAGPASQVQPTAEQTSVLYRALLAADRQGLRSSDYLTPDIERLLTAQTPWQRSEGEARLIEATLSFATHLRRGRTPDKSFRSDWAIRPPAFDARAELQAALAAGGIEAWLSGLAPGAPGYRRLTPQLVRYQTIVTRGGWPALDIRKPLKLGMEAAGVDALRRRLEIEGFTSTTPSDPHRFDAALQTALSAYQSSRGLTPSGEADRRTLQALNVPAAVRLASIRASLERWRWAPRDLPPTRIEVNVAAAHLQLFVEGAPVLAMRTVVGRPADPTPMFADSVESVVFNPPWNVPETIASREILPKAARDPGYLAREDFVWIEQDGKRRLQQQAGPKSALGRYKFDLPNSFNVYLHDTPNHDVFARETRDLSHGCVRLQDPRALAVRLLGRQGWSPEMIDAAVSAGQTSRVRLDQSVPVYFFYFTAFVADDGTLNFRDDIYGWDRVIARAD